MAIGASAPGTSVAISAIMNACGPKSNTNAPTPDTGPRRPRTNTIQKKANDSPVLITTLTGISRAGTGSGGRNRQYPYAGAGRTGGVARGVARWAGRRRPVA